MLRILRAHVRKTLPGAQSGQFGPGEVFGEPASEGVTGELLGRVAAGELGARSDIRGDGNVVFVAQHQHAISGGDDVGFDRVGAELEREGVGGTGVFGAVAAGSAVTDDKRGHLHTVTPTSDANGRSR